MIDKVIALSTATLLSLEPLSSGSSAFEPLPPESSQKTSPQPQLVLYIFTAESGERGLCSGVSLDAFQFATSRHCTMQFQKNFDAVKIVGHQDSSVKNVKEIPDADVSIITLNQSSFEPSCTRIASDVVPIAQRLDLYTLSEQGKLVTKEVIVEDNNYSSFNPDLQQETKRLLETVPLDGKPTKEGDSGSPAIAADGKLAGIVVGISERTGHIIIEPSEKFYDEVRCLT